MKILSTIGPISESVYAINNINKYTNLFRLNLSHNNIAWHKRITERIKSIDNQNKILIDIPGIKPRTNNDSDIFIKKREKVYFYYGKAKIKNYLKIQLTNPIPKIPKYNKFFSLSDGSYYFNIYKTIPGGVIGVSQQSFILKKKKGLNIPGSIYSNDRQIKITLDYLNKIKKLKFEVIGLSFVQNEKVIKTIRNKYPEKIILSKIENSEALKNIKKIINYSDIVMIDRGDLAAEIGTENLFSSILNISKICFELGKPLIMATENLESMINSTAPTKSEIISIAFSEYLDSDIIMLSDETATSKNYIKILSWLKNFIKKNNKNNLKNNYLINKNNDYFSEIFQNITINTIVVFTKKGYVLEKIFKKNKKKNIIVFSSSKKIIDQCNFRSKCTAIYTKKFTRFMQHFIFMCIKKYKDLIFRFSDRVLLTFVNYPNKGATANTLSIVSKNMFN